MMDMRLSVCFQGNDRSRFRPQSDLQLGQRDDSSTAVMGHRRPGTEISPFEQDIEESKLIFIEPRLKSLCSVRMGNVTHLQIEGEIREHDEGSTYFYLGRGFLRKRLASPKLYFPKKEPLSFLCPRRKS